MKLALAWLVFAVIGSAIGVAARLPFPFGGLGDAVRVSEDFLSKGTAVSPPIVALVILITGIVVALRPGLVGRLGSGLLVLLAAVFFVATIGEVIGASAFSGPTQIFAIAWNLLGLYRSLSCSRSALLRRFAAPEFIASRVKPRATSCALQRCRA